VPRGKIDKSIAMAIRLLTLIVPCALARLDVRVPSAAFMWSADSRFGGKQVYKVEPTDAAGVSNAILSRSQDFEAPEVVVAFITEQLAADQVMDYSIAGEMKSIREAMLTSESSMVLPSVYLSAPDLSSSVADLLSSQDGSIHIAGVNPGSLQSWAKQFSTTPVLDLATLQDSTIFENGVTDTIFVPLDLEVGGNVVQDVLQAIGTRSHVALFTALYPVESVTGLEQNSPAGRKLLAAASDADSEPTYRTFNKITPDEFHKFIYSSSDATTGILLGLVLVWCVILAVSCTMAIQTPSLMWPKDKPLPQMGRVDFG